MATTTEGLNVVGICPNPECKSAKNRAGGFVEDRVYVIAYECSDCGHEWSDSYHLVQAKVPYQREIEEYEEGVE
jgi:hypothetical protein